jgi:hypothetical protein
MNFPEQSEDVRARPIAITIAATVAAILASALVVWLLLGRQPHGGGRSDEQHATTFDERTPAEATRATQRQALDRWTWADAAHTRVRMPVSEAIDAYLRGKP